jgi:predicted ester cyclase
VRLRGGLAHLANNARDQGFPAPGRFLRDAFPDRVDVIEDIIAEDDRVGLLWRLTGTHTGNLYGIPPTGRRVDIHEIGLFWLADGRITEGWFMADELGLLKQLGTQLPPRKDGQSIVPPLTDAGEDGDVVVKRLMATQPTTQQDRNKLKVARSKSSFAQKEDRAARRRQQGMDAVQPARHEYAELLRLAAYRQALRNDRGQHLDLCR